MIPGNWFRARYVNNRRTYYYEDKDPITVDMDGNIVDDDYKPAKHIWDTFYDTSTGEVIDSYEKIKDKERQGLVFTDHDDAARVANYNRERIRTEDRERNRQELNNSIMELVKQRGGDFRITG